MTEERPTLLVVDDVETNIDILLDALDDDHTVRVATDGFAALESVKRNLPDLILLDIMMPGMDGFEVCRRLKDDPITRNIPIIFITAMNEDVDEARGLALGAVDYITKPFNRAIVKARVRNHLELKKHRDHLEVLVEERTRELARAHVRVTELELIKDDFLKMISHEIRTPANGLLGIGEMIIDLCPESKEAALYSQVFRKNSLRLCRLIDDATMIADIEKTTPACDAAISFSVLLDDVMVSLEEINISIDPSAAVKLVFIKGDHRLLMSALKTMILMATSFSRDKQTAHLLGSIEPRNFHLRFFLDNLSLTEEQAANFFEIGSSARSSSTAETLGLAPVVAAKIISAFGGEMRLIKEKEEIGYLEALFRLDQGHVYQT